MFQTIRHFRQLIGAFIALILMQAASAGTTELDCMVKPEMYIELSSPVTGVLEKVFVDKGDRISKGQAVAQLEASVELARVKQAKSSAANNGELNNRKVKLDFAKRTKERYHGLSQKNSVSQYEKDKADTEVSLAEIELRKEIENKKAAALALELAQAQLALKTIKSPIDGIVIDRYAMVGESVTDRAIMKLAQVDPLRVELVAPTEYFGLIQQGMAVEIHPERPAGKSLKATVTVVDQLIDPASGSFTVRMALPNPDVQLVGGVNCTALFNFDVPVVNPSVKPGANKLPSSLELKDIH
jgi:RND family efflux transporter MFP subunit